MARRIIGQVASIGIFWLLVSLFVMSLWHIILLQSFGLSIVCLPPSIYHWICVLHSTLFWEVHNLWRNTIYIGLLSFSPILAIDANGGEVSESFVEKFRELSHLALVLFLSIFISFACTIGCCIAWWCIIPYINSLESDCHQLPKWGRLKEHAVPPCLVLVIDDNLYGLMVALSYIWRICP